MRIIQEYKNSITKPAFQINKNNIRITLPVIEMDQSSLSDDEFIIYNILRDEIELTI